MGCFSRQIGAFRWFTALRYPVPLVFFFALFARSAMRSGKTVAWNRARFQRLLARRT